MGFFRDLARGSKDSSKNRKIAEQKVDKEIDDFRYELSLIGDVLELDYDNYRSLSISVLQNVLDYNTLVFSESYLGYTTDTHSFDYVSSYSGTIDSSGNVSVSPNYSSGSYATVSREAKNYYDNIIIKAVEKGEGETVKNLENKFFSEEGDLYLKIENANSTASVLNLDKTAINNMPGKMWTTQRALAVANLIFVICLFAAFNLVVNTTIYVEDDASALFFGLPLVALIIFYVVIGQILKRCKRDLNTSFLIRDSMSSGFLAVIIILVVISFLACMFSWSAEEYTAGAYLVSLVIELVALVVSIIFLVRSANKNDKNRYARLYKLASNSVKLTELEDLASEIRSYTKKVWITETHDPNYPQKKYKIVEQK